MSISAKEKAVKGITIKKIVEGCPTVPLKFMKLPYLRQGTLVEHYAVGKIENYFLVNSKLDKNRQMI